MNAHCPKCGSDQILNDECLKCGVIVSKAQSAAAPAQPSVPKSISYVAPGAQPASPAAPYSWRPATMQGTPSTRSSDFTNLPRKIFYALLSLLTLGAVYQGYRYFAHQAASYGGYYRNTYEIFSLNFPEKGWFHYSPGYLKVPEFKDAKDAFYRGSDPDDPDVMMAVWTELIPNPVPERLDDNMAERLKTAIEDEVEKRMKKTNLECHITDSQKIFVGGNDGFVVYADLKTKQANMKTMIYCGFNGSKAYTVQFLGKDRYVLDNKSEIETMMQSFTFSTRII
jgi:hypothetical protein